MRVGPGELDHKESWAPKNWCFWTVVLEKTLESPLDCKESKPVNPKGNQSWIFIGRADAEAEAPILWPPDAKNWLIRKDPDAGKDRRQEEKGMTEDEMVRWHPRLNGHEFKQALGVGGGQGSLASCSTWGRKESDTTEWLNWIWLLLDHETFRGALGSHCLPFGISACKQSVQLYHYVLAEHKTICPYWDLSYSEGNGPNMRSSKSGMWSFTLIVGSRIWTGR